ncbi:hypothetical protein V6N11_022622 [Hibiscus sabdariffa]|uniref:phosphoglycerate mutase (2,3-diphosphoglycerate-dependent) n=1 Tax=Hibiscus sabdariffa TaxID=183260 RepID=A0ABR2TJS1_9ROSI
MFLRTIGTIQLNLNSSGNEWGACKKHRNYSLQLISKAFAVDVRLLAKRNSIYGLSKLHVVRALSSHSSEVYPVSSVSQNTDDYKKNTSAESVLILIRHGESLWNEKNLFTGCVNVPLSKKGVEEAVEAGKRISNIPVDMIYTSLLIRAQMTAMLVMTEHRHKKVPIIQRNKSDREKEYWSQVSSEETIRQSVPVITAWELNERMYGELQGLNKQETAERYGEEKVREWRRSYDIPPPNGESLEMCSRRAVAYFREHVEPQLQSGKHVMIASHANSLRSIIMYLEKLTPQEVTALELPTATPLLYIYKGGEFIRRGRLVGSKEAGVYAYTKETTKCRILVPCRLQGSLQCISAGRHQSLCELVEFPWLLVCIVLILEFNIPKIFASKRRGRGGSDDDFAAPDSDTISADLEKKIKIASGNKDFLEASSRIRRNFLERRESAGLIEGLNLSNFECSMASVTEIRDFRIFVATWNVGGKTPNSDMNLEDFFIMEGSADIYVCGFQEIVPLNAGNVLVSEDNEPAAKWLVLINQALNKPRHSPKHSSPDSGNDSKTSDTDASKELKSPTNPQIFDKTVLKILNKNFRSGSSLLKTCNCPVYSTYGVNRMQKTVRDLANDLDLSHLPVGCDTSIRELVELSEMFPLCSTEEMNYRLITSKQMVGLFLSIWARKELMPYIGHVRVSSVGRGIMKRLGNKGCIAVSISLHQTSLCFVCSHLASGEKEGDELRRNADVSEILKGLQFPIICKTPNHRAPEKIVEHDRVIWLGDLNYRVALSYETTRTLLEENNWDTLLEKDQLNMEREAGRVFDGFKEGWILFAPTYKYSYNSDSYAGENGKSKKKRRTPAWCDRILWRGSGIEQLTYIRGESRFSDHRPVSSLFSVEVIVRRKYDKFKKGYSCGLRRFDYEECIPRRHSFYDC